MQSVRLLIIHSNQMIRRGLASLFDAHGFNVVGEIDLITDVNFLQRLQPDVVLYGLNIQDEKSLSLISTIKEVCPCTLVVILTDLNKRPGIIAAFAAGADGYLKTPILPADLVTAINLTCRSGICFYPRAAKDTIIRQTASIKKWADNGEG